MKFQDIYRIENTDDIISPSLIYYLDVIKQNTEEVIRTAGDVNRLWPHIKTHKCEEMVKLLMSYGINKFKTATIAEAEMAAHAGSKQIILAYPLIGPNMQRLINLQKAYPDATFYAIEDDLDQLSLLSQKCIENDIVLKCLIDVNLGLNRTGVEIDKLEDLYTAASGLKGLDLVGLHCYDGNHHQVDFNERNEAVKSVDERIEKVVDRLLAKGLNCSIIVAGGTPSFPCHAVDTNWYLSPGTSFINDAGYMQNIPDLPCTPGAAVLTRVVSHPAPGYFTIDLGYKGIAADPQPQRGFIVGLEDAEQVMQNEEHWVFKLADPDKVPPIGSVLYVIPTHICPTTALYPEVLVAQGGKIVDRWQVTARNRKITY